ncbi:MAG: hypothetical protein PVF58_05805 [Candidatus Methanofastidiosia archaeon]|jgi:hypothetical protein
MDEPVIYVLKWIVVVLVAGFIGYIGRYLAMLLLKKFRKEPSEQTITKTEDKSDKYKYKTEKKRLKAELKKIKKQ